VIDVRDDAEVASKLNSHGSGHYAGAAAHGQSTPVPVIPGEVEESLDYWKYPALTLAGNLRKAVPQRVAIDL
jgi:hypothetical protein